MTNDATFQQLESLKQSQGAAATIDQLIETLRTRGEYHKLFDALLLKKKFELGLPLAQPTSFDDVPAEKDAEFRQTYISVAREVGEALLAQGNIAHAWIYLRTIGEPQKVRDALEALDPRRSADERSEEILQIALYEGAHPVKGLQLMLESHGTCSTVTAMDQAVHQMAPDDRARAASLLVRKLYDDLCYSLRHEVSRKIALAPPGETLRELIAGRDWLFAEGNYHIDVSHLNAVVRFARFLEPGSPDLAKAIQLAEYGSHLAPQLQYAGDPPFDDFYPAHVQFFKALADQQRDEALAYFRDKLDAEPDEQDKPMLAYVLVDLLVRVGRMDEAVGVAERYLKDLDPSTGFSFARLCQDAGRMDRLRAAARDKGDLVTYTAALVAEGAA